MSVLVRLRQKIGPTEDERFAEHVRRVDVRQDIDAERHRTYGLPEPELRPDPKIIRRILHGKAVPPMECWRY
jgi:hypothetical protein